MPCELSTSSPVPAADCSPISSSATLQSEQLSLIPTVAESCENEPPTDGSPSCACTKSTFGCSIHPNTPAEWIASQRVSLASLIRSLASERAKLTNVIFGPTPHGLLATYDRGTSGWKTSPGLFPTDTPPLSSENFPRWGMTVAGRLFPLPMLELHTGGNGGGASPQWQTPVADDAVNRQGGKWNSRSEPKLSAQVMLPTPTVGDSKNRTYQYDNHDKTKPRLSLSGVAQAWPTPTSTLGTKGGRVTPRKSREGGTLI